MAYLQLERRWTDLQQIMNSVIQHHAPALKGRQIYTEYTQIPPVFVDPGRVHQILSHLLLKAVRATPEGGVISIRMDCWGSKAAIYLQDTGSGISPDDLPQFFQSPDAPPGVELGLLLCKKLVELHQGRIEIGSELGRGTIFAVLLPIAPDQGRFSPAKPLLQAA